MAARIFETIHGLLTGLVANRTFALSKAFKSTFRPAFASDDKKPIGSSTGVTESKVRVWLSLTIFLGL